MPQRKKDSERATLEDFEDAFESSSKLRKSKKNFSDARRIRKVMPMGMRVLVEIRKESDQTDSGLYLPEGAKSHTQESVLAEVLEVASATDQNSEEETNISGIPAGSLVLIPKHAGIKVPWDEDKRIVDSKDILAIVSEMSLV